MADVLWTERRTHGSDDGSCERTPLSAAQLSPPVEPNTPDHRG